jgi:Protein of unknown function (DUF732)
VPCGQPGQGVGMTATRRDRKLPAKDRTPLDRVTCIWSEAHFTAIERGTAMIDKSARITAITAAGAMAVAAALALAPAAHAETGGGDTQFLSIIQQHIFGLTSDNGDAGLTYLGQLVCQKLAMTGGDRDGIHQQLANKWKSESKAAWFTTAAAVAYCPEYILTSDRW